MIKLECVRLQTVFFLAAFDFSNKLDLALTLREASDGLFDSDPIILPVPDDAPKAFPRLVFKSKDELWSYQVALNRLESIFELPPERLGTIGFEEILEQQAQLGSRIWKSLQTKYHTSGNRMGVVSTFVNLGDELVNTLRSTFLQPSDAPEPHELQLHTLNKLTFREFGVNRWIRCVAGSPKPNTFETSNILTVEVDLNTVPEAEFDLTSDKIQWFFSQVKEEVLTVKTSLFEDTTAKRFF